MLTKPIFPGQERTAGFKTFKMHFCSICFLFRNTRAQETIRACQKLTVEGLHDSSSKKNTGTWPAPCPSNRLLTGREVWRVPAHRVKRPSQSFVLFPVFARSAKRQGGSLREGVGGLPLRNHLVTSRTRILNPSCADFQLLKGRAVGLWRPCPQKIFV